MGTILLTRYEVARIVGLRSLQLSEGVNPNITIENKNLANDTLYIAALELYSRKLDAKIERDGELFHVKEATLPPSVAYTLDLIDGKQRSIF